MPVQIGAKSHAFSDPTGLLNDCHRRIEMFLHSLHAAGEAMSGPVTDDVRQALETALRYFAQAAPKHTADEERSLFPRMRGLNSPEVLAAFSELDKLEQDHRSAEALHAEVDRLANRYLTVGTLSRAEVNQFQNAVAELESMYARHIQVEDEKIFPLAARLLPDDQKSAIAQEMADRRNVKIESHR
jgi:hemerythrin-like domain-containing protein